MGMTIDESIEIIEQNINIGASKVDCALEIAIDTMHKYQKIEKILSDWINNDSVGMSDYWMGRIKEVIEDGSENNHHAHNT